MMNIIYSLKHPFFEQFRSNNEAWPWESNPEQWKIDRKTMLRRTFTNIVVFNSIFALLIFNNEIDRFTLDYSNLPSYSTVLLQSTFCFLLTDFSFYWLHRLAHHPKLYWIHKQHHESVNTTVYAAMSVHPLEW